MLTLKNELVYILGIIHIFKIHIQIMDNIIRPRTFFPYNSAILWMQVRNILWRNMHITYWTY